MNREISDSANSTMKTILMNKHASGTKNRATSNCFMELSKSLNIKIVIQVFTLLQTILNPGTTPIPQNLRRLKA